MKNIFKSLQYQGFQVEARVFSNQDGAKISESIIYTDADFEATLLQNNAETTALFVVLQNGLEIAYDLETAKRLVDFGIKTFYRRADTHTIATIGHDKNGSWFGWSHRAVGKFSIGDVVKVGDVVAGEGVRVGLKISTETTARMLAVKFAEAVS
jgi:hypothetical protein